MNAFLKFVAVTILIAGGFHTVLGVGADAMLGVNLPPTLLADPSLNSQNRFYGFSYTLYGILLWLCTTDMTRYGLVFRLLLAMTFAGGVTRIISVALHGWQTPAVIALALSELLLPPILLWWFARR